MEPGNPLALGGVQADCPLLLRGWEGSMKSVRGGGFRSILPIPLYDSLRCKGPGGSLALRHDNPAGKHQEPTASPRSAPVEVPPLQRNPLLLGVLLVFGLLFAGSRFRRRARAAATHADRHEKCAENHCRHQFLHCRTILSRRHLRVDSRSPIASGLVPLTDSSPHRDLNKL